MGRRKKGEDDSTVRNRLLDRIGDLFLSRGSNYTMDELSRSFRVSKKTLYRFFPTRDDIILQVARLFTSWMKASVERRLRRVEAEGPQAFIPQVTGFIVKLGSILLSTQPSLISDMERWSPSLFEQFDELRRDVMRSLFGRVLDVGKKLGKIRQDIDSEIASQIYSGMIGQLVSSRGHDPTHAPYEVFATAIKIFFEGILSSESRPEFQMSTLPRLSTGNPWREMKKEAEEQTEQA